MVELNNIQRIYFIGIGGIGMSAIARYFNQKNISVSGYDKTPTAITRQMEQEGINIHYEDSVYMLDKEAQVIIYTPAIPKDHSELNFYRQHNYEILKRSDILQLITNEGFNICIAGTHGKTTITTLVAHILRDSGYGCTAFLGGIAVNYGTNFWKSDNNVFAVEADEYDRSFLKLNPDIALISAMDADHLDIYGTEEVMQQAFIDFANNLKAKGLLISKFGLSKLTGLHSAKHIKYSLQNESADAYGANIKMQHGGYQFDLLTKDWMLDNIQLHMGGLHNVENAIAAIVIAHYLKIDNAKIREAVKNFKGIKRRFEYVIVPSSESNEKNEIILIDDYAHHPEELRALINGAKSLFNGMKCTIIFQPHLFSRTKDLAQQFAEVLDLADQIILLPVYPARELPIEGVSSELIYKKMNNANKYLFDKKELLSWLKNFSGDPENVREVFITAGAGDIDTLVEPVKNILTSKIKANNYA